MVTVTISDPRARFYGFQMTARLASEPVNGQAGDFKAGSGQLVLCNDGSGKGSLGCQANESVQFIEHSTPSNTGKWSVAWTPPSVDVGDVFIFVAGNSNTQTDTPQGAHVYTAHYTLSAASAGGSKPSIVSAKVAGDFNSAASVTSGTWLEIKGSNLATATRSWASPDFQGANAPTTLNGASVMVDGKPAYVSYASPVQINLQVPDISRTAQSVQLMVANASGQSDPITLQTTPISPALLAPLSFNINGKQYVVAQFASDGAYVLNTNLISGVKSRPAKARDIIVIYGIGFGPVNPGNPAGVVTSQVNSLQTNPTFRFGQTAATLLYDGLAPNFVGLYQFNIQVPAVSSGDQPLNVDVGGVSTNQTLFITMQ